MLKDKDIREPLFFFLEEKYGKIRILEEKNTGRSRADAVMVTDDALYGIEIKSDADTYARLSRQVEDYDRYYDRNIVVVGSSHAHHIREHVPDHWGVITVEMEEGDYDFYVMREPLPNTEATFANKLEFLWRPEIAKIQEEHDMPAYNYLSKSKVIGKIIEWTDDGRIPKDRLQAQICELLFERDYNTIFDEINKYRQEHGLHKRRRTKKRRKRSK